MSEEIEFKKKVREVYDAAVRLWSASRVEHHGEGHPGVPGPSGLQEADWDSDRALLSGAIQTLSLIVERKSTKPQHVRLVCTVVGDEFAQPFHAVVENNDAGVRSLKEMVAAVWCGERWQDELPASCRPAESFIEGEGMLAMFEYYFRHHWIETYYISTFEIGAAMSLELQKQREDS